VNCIGFLDASPAPLQRIVPVWLHRLIELNQHHDKQLTMLLHMHTLHNSTGDAHMSYHCDLKPGELFGDAALNGSTILRSHTAVAVSHCCLLTIDVQDFARIRDHGHVLVSHEQRFHFLKQVLLQLAALCFALCERVCTLSAHTAVLVAALTCCCFSLCSRML
jgi:hypothetical protein